jgi:hypothetical protein
MTNDSPPSHGLIECVRELEQRLGAPAGEFEKYFTNDDDWSVAIKISAFIEGSVSHLLAEHLDTRLLPLFSRMELGTSTSGKLAFAKELDLLPTEYRRAISAIAEIRNRIAHDIKHAAFTFTTYRAALNRDQRKNLDDALLAIFEPTSAASWRPVLDDGPKILVVLVAMLILAHIKLRISTLHLDRERERLDQKEADLLIAELAGQVFLPKPPDT